MAVFGRACKWSQQGDAMRLTMQTDDALPMLTSSATIDRSQWRRPHGPIRSVGGSAAAGGVVRQDTGEEDAGETGAQVRACLGCRLTTPLRVVPPVSAAGNERSWRLNQWSV